MVAPITLRTDFEWWNLANLLLIALITSQLWQYLGITWWFLKLNHWWNLQVARVFDSLSKRYWLISWLYKLFCRNLRGLDCLEIFHLLNCRFCKPIKFVVYFKNFYLSIQLLFFGNLEVLVVLLIYDVFEGRGYYLQVPQILVFVFLCRDYFT